MSKKREIENQVKTLDEHAKDLDNLYLKLEKEGFSADLLTQINNKRCKISILQKQLDSSKLKTKKAY